MSNHAHLIVASEQCGELSNISIALYQGSTEVYATTLSPAQQGRPQAFRFDADGGTYTFKASAAGTVAATADMRIARFSVAQVGTGFDLAAGNKIAYRYGFNGKEKDQNGEWGNAISYDYGFRIYNPAMGRFLSVDPLTADYPFYTPYQFAGNKPIVAIDMDGLEEYIIHSGFLSDVMNAALVGLSELGVSNKFKKQAVLAMIKRWKNRDFTNIKHKKTAQELYGYKGELIETVNENGPLDVWGYLVPNEQFSLFSTREPINPIISFENPNSWEAKNRRWQKIRDQSHGRMIRALVEEEREKKNTLIGMAIGTIAASGTSIAIAAAEGAAGAIIYSIVVDGASIVLSSDDIAKLSSDDNSGFLEKHLTQKQIDGIKVAISSISLTSGSGKLNSNSVLVKAFKKFISGIGGLNDVITIITSGDNLLKETKKNESDKK